MNPLDPLELESSLRDINNEMPFHTETTSRVPYTYDKLPKNLMDEAARVNNKFLNNFENVIEEMYHRDSKHALPNWFRQYQKKYYASYGILKADGFFKQDEFGLPKNTRHEMGGGIIFANAPPFIPPRILGALLETNQSTTNTNTFNSNILWGFRFPNTAVIGSLYDSIACSGNGLAGNAHYGCYDNSAGLPHNLLCDTGSIVMTNDYAIHNVTEFSVTTTQLWLSLILNSDFNAFFIGFQTLGDAQDVGTAYGPLPNPFPGGLSASSQVIRGKILHS